VVSNEQDVGADFLIRELQTRGSHVVRLNSERSAEWELNLEPGLRWQCRMRRRAITSDDCVGVWWRRPEVPKVAAALGPAAEAVADQWRAFLAALASVPGPIWVSDPADIRRAEGKALQLSRAREIGFDVPETSFSNDVKHIHELLMRWPAPAVAKSIASAWWEVGDEGRFVFASPLTVSDLPEASRFAAAPVCVQQAILPKRDVRVTVVGSAVFAAVRGDRDSAEGEALDWRLEPQREWMPYELPSSVEACCARLVRAFGLRFGGIDLAVDEEERHWFLELNPNGEWGWLQRAGLPIAEALADVFTET
jgi:glutathione synthase/RimK-type ligase-like ATP-grasp enzyme